MVVKDSRLARRDVLEHAVQISVSGHDNPTARGNLNVRRQEELDNLPGGRDRVARRLSQRPERELAGLILDEKRLGEVGQP